jgi:hypothetical protein
VKEVDKMSFQIINISQLFNNGRSVELINKINEDAVQKDHLLILLDLNKFKEKQLSFVGFDLVDMIYEIPGKRDYIPSPSYPDDY